MIPIIVWQFFDWHLFTLMPWIIWHYSAMRGRSFNLVKFLESRVGSNKVLLNFVLNLWWKLRKISKSLQWLFFIPINTWTTMKLPHLNHLRHYLYLLMHSYWWNFLFKFLGLQFLQFAKLLFRAGPVRICNIIAGHILLNWKQSPLVTNHFSRHMWRLFMVSCYSLGAWWQYALFHLFFLKDFKILHQGDPG